MKALLLIVAAIAAIAAIAAPAALDKPPVIKEWPVPWADTRPRDPYLDPTTNRIWFCGQAGNYLAYFVPATGEVKRYDLPAGSGPHNLIVGNSGFVWVSRNPAGASGGATAADGNHGRRQDLVRGFRRRHAGPLRSGDGQGRRVGAAGRRGCPAVRDGARR